MSSQTPPEPPEGLRPPEGPGWPPPESTSHPPGGSTSQPSYGQFTSPVGQPPVGQPMSGDYQQPPQYSAAPRSSQPTAYPQQDLLPQHVQAGRNRKPLYLALAVVLVLIAGGSTAYLLLRDDGEDTRAEYCSALREFTDDGDLLSAVAGADASALSEFERIEGLAPQTVGADWQALRDLTETIQRGEIDVVTGMSAVSHLRSIAADADQECGLTIDIPGF